MGEHEFCERNSAPLTAAQLFNEFKDIIAGKKECCQNITDARVVQIRIGIGYLIKDRFIIMENLMFLIIVTDVNFRTETKITAIRRNELINDFEDRCLSRTVIADKGHTLTPFNIHGYILKQILTVITFCQIFNE